MQSPRARAASRIAGETITQPAWVAASCGWYFGLDRKLSDVAVADSSGARSSMGRSRSPCSSPPSASTIRPRACGTLRLLRRVERADHLVGDIVLRVDVHGLLQDHVVVFLLGDLLDDAVGAVEHLLQLFVLARVQVFLEFAALALEVAVHVDHRLLALRALALRQCRRLALELLGPALQRR